MTVERNHSKLLAEALEHVTDRNTALDLGAGTFSDSKYLLSQGFKKVIALDIEPFGSLPDSRFSFIKSSFEEYDFPVDTFDVINARFSLPFCKPDAFGAVWKHMIDSLKTGGIFSGHLFGRKDAWVSDPFMTFHTKQQVQELLSGLKVIKEVEVEKDEPTAAGHMKHWHFYAIIFKKP